MLTRSGTRSRVQRSERVDEREDREVDAYSAGCVGRYLCVAVESFEELLHQAEIDVDETGV